MKPRRLWLNCWVLFAMLLWGTWPMGFCAAADFVEDFDTAKPTWTVLLDPQTTTVSKHVRTRKLAHDGVAAEYVEVQSETNGGEYQLEHALEPARVLDELSLSLWYKSNVDGAKLSVRIVFPHQLNPRTGQILTVLLDGPQYTQTSRWQKLECLEMGIALRKQLPLLHSRIFRDSGAAKSIDQRGSYVDRVVLQVPTGRGQMASVMDELRLGPVVKPSQTGVVVQTQGEQTEPAATAEFQFKLDRLQLAGHACMPRWLPYHGERPEELARLGVNLVWVPDYRDATLLHDLRQQGLRTIATPPRAAADATQNEVNLVPFGPEADAVDMWYLGTRIPAEAKSQLISWSEQVGNADHKLRRPLVADVSALENTYSRHVSLLGASRHILHSSFTFKSYRQWLVERRQLAQPGSFLWTWIQTEPVVALQKQRKSADLAPLVVEPEQLRLQVYAALGAGYRGLAYWTHAALDAEYPGAQERRLALTQLNLELELIEPWLATADFQGLIPFSVTLPRTANLKQLDLGFGSGQRNSREHAGQLNSRDNLFRQQERLGRELEAALFRTEYGLLLLPLWCGETAQFCPPQSAGNNAVIVVPGVNESAAAWEVSTTSIRNLTPNVDCKRVTGGLQVTLKKFDLSSIIIFTSDRALIQKLREKMESLRERSAETSVQLARAKLSRVTEIDRQLHSLGAGQVDSAQLLSRAAVLIEQATQAARQNECQSAREHSNDALQTMRILQHAYWSDAVRNLSSPISSPHALCFNTLPEHWRLVQRLGRSTSKPASNLLRSGDFEDRDTLLSAGWRHEQATIENVNSTAELYPQPHQGRSALRLIAVPAKGADPPSLLRERPVTMISPPILVRKGQLLYIGGFARLVAPSLGSLDGAMLYDSIGGSAMAFRWRTPQTEYQPFELLRIAPESGEMTITMTLTGLGELLVDDLRVLAYEPDPESTPGLTVAPGKPKGNAFDFLKKLPGFGQRLPRQPQ